MAFCDGRINVAAQDSAAYADDLFWLSRGTEQFEHNGVVVRPGSVVLDVGHDRLTVIVDALSDDPSEPAPIDRFNARVGAFAVAGALRRTLPRFSVSLYLRYPGGVDVPVDAQLEQTARRIRNRRRQLRRRSPTGQLPEPGVIPGPVLAYVLSTAVESA